MSAFSSAHSYLHFAASIRSKWRFTRNELQAQFLDVLLATSQQRRETIPSGSLLYRAQLGCNWPETEDDEAEDPGPRPFDVDRMMPWRNRAYEGRVNPKGIPCLYTATEEQTAAAEVRPWAGAFVSVAQLRTSRELDIINCTSDDRRLMFYLKEPDPPEREIAVWRDIDRAFAQPVDREEHSAQYAPTQVIAEAFRQAGSDGIGYRSSLGTGFNIALFDLDAADLLNCTVLHVKGITFKMDEAANRYFVSKHYRKGEDGEV